MKFNAWFLTFNKIEKIGKGTSRDIINEHVQAIPTASIDSFDCIEFWICTISLSTVTNLSRTSGVLTDLTNLFFIQIKQTTKGDPTCTCILRASSYVWRGSHMKILKKFWTRDKYQVKNEKDVPKLFISEHAPLPFLQHHNSPVLSGIASDHSILPKTWPPTSRLWIECDRKFYYSRSLLFHLALLLFSQPYFYAECVSHFMLKSVITFCWLKGFASFYFVQDHKVFVRTKSELFPFVFSYRVLLYTNTVTY